MALGTSAARAAGDAQAADTQVCSADRLTGLYLWTFDGYTRLGGNLLPKAVMQGLQFNGKMQRLNNTFGTVNIGGTITIDATGGVGIYTVTADCTGTMLFTNGPSFNMYIGPGAQQLWITQTNGGPCHGTGLGVGTATRQPRAVKPHPLLSRDSTSDQLRVWRVPSALPESKRRHDPPYSDCVKGATRVDIDA